MNDVPFQLWDRQCLNLSDDCSTFCVHTLASVESLDVAVDGCLHVVEDVSALKNLHGLATSPVAGRHGVVTTRDDFLYTGVWHKDSVVGRIFAIVECRERLRVRHFPWLLAIC